MSEQGGNLHVLMYEYTFFTPHCIFFYLFFLALIHYSVVFSLILINVRDWLIFAGQF